MTPSSPEQNNEIGAQVRRFAPEDIERMRNEMMTQYAPDTLDSSRDTAPL